MGFLSSIGSAIGGVFGVPGGSAIGGLVGGLLSGKDASDAAAAQAAATRDASAQSAEAAKFRPVGVTTRFGGSNFTMDDKGYVKEAGYTLSPELKALQDRLMGMTGGLVDQYQTGQTAAAPMGEAAQRAMALGQQYLGASPQEQSQKWLANQQALLSAGREQQLAGLQNKLQQQGRLGLATGGTSNGMMATNPEMQAYYNAIMQQDLGLAAQADQAGREYATFGTGLVGVGGDLLKGMYGTQTAAYSPFNTAFTGAQTMEGLGQQSFDLGTNIGAKGMSPAAANALLTGGMAAANAQYKADSYSPFGTLLSGFGKEMSGMQKGSSPQANTSNWGGYDYLDF